MKKIYIILSNSNSYVSKTLKLITKEKYVHVSISLDKELNDAYSFGRKYTRFAFPGGFINEQYKKRNKYFKNYIIKIFSIDVTDKQYNDIYNDIMNNYLVNSNKLKYNYLGLINICLNKPNHRKNSFVCSQFCSKLLIDNNILDFKKDYSLIKPIDFFNLAKCNFVYEGALADYLK